MDKKVFDEIDVNKTTFEDRWVRFAFGAQGHVKDEGLNLGTVEFDKNLESLVHKHDVDEALYVLSGKGSISLDDKIYELAPGSYVSIPKNTDHRIITGPDSKIKILFIFSGKIVINE